MNCKHRSLANTADGLQRCIECKEILNPNKPEPGAEYSWKCAMKFVVKPLLEERDNLQYDYDEAKASYIELREAGQDMYEAMKAYEMDVDPDFPPTKEHIKMMARWKALYEGKTVPNKVEKPSHEDEVLKQILEGLEDNEIKKTKALKAHITELKAALTLFVDNLAVQSVLAPQESFGSIMGYAKSILNKREENEHRNL